MRMKPAVLAVVWSVAMICVAALGVASAPVRAQVAVPALSSPVVDTTRTLTPAQVARLQRQARDLQRRTGSQLQILIVSSTRPEDTADYAQRVFETWQLGRKGVDDGVLLLIAKGDRRARIHVGAGLERAISNDAAGRIIQTALVPRLSAGDFNGGLIESSAALVALIDGRPPPARTPPDARDRAGPAMPAADAGRARAVPPPAVHRDRSGPAAAPVVETFDAQWTPPSFVPEGQARNLLHTVLAAAIMCLVLIPTLGGLLLLVYRSVSHAVSTPGPLWEALPDDDAPRSRHSGDEDVDWSLDDWSTSSESSGGSNSGSSGGSSSGGWSGGGGRSGGGGASGGW